MLFNNILICNLIYIHYLTNREKGATYHGCRFCTGIIGYSFPWKRQSTWMEVPDELYYKLLSYHFSYVTQ